MATIYIPINWKMWEVGTSAIPEEVAIAGTNDVVYGRAFDAAAREDIYFDLVIPLFGASATTMNVNLMWYSRSGSTTGDVIWGARLGALTPSDAQSMETDGYGTAATVTTTVLSTAKGMKLSTVAITSLDSLAALDLVKFNVYRDAAAGGDTMSGDAILKHLYLSYSDT